MDESAEGNPANVLVSYLLVHRAKAVMELIERHNVRPHFSNSAFTARYSFKIGKMLSAQSIL